MICLKEIDLSKAEEKKQKVISIRTELEKEQNELRDLLVVLNLDYYGTSPSNYYKSIKKDYVTDDDYSVRIEQGLISISKRLQENLTLMWRETFSENTSFSIYRSIFRYDYGRHIDSPITKDKMAKKYKNEVMRIQEIIEEEKVYNPFSEYLEFYSFLDFLQRK